MQNQIEVFQDVTRLTTRDRRRQADADGEDHGAMGYALAEGLCLAEFGIHVMVDMIQHVLGRVRMLDRLQ